MPQCLDAMRLCLMPIVAGRDVAAACLGAAAAVGAAAVGAALGVAIEMLNKCWVRAMSPREQRAVLRHKARSGRQQEERVEGRGRERERGEEAREKETGVVVVAGVERLTGQWRRFRAKSTH